MKTRFILLLSIACCATAHAQEQQVIYYPDGKKAMEGRWHYEDASASPARLLQNDILGDYELREPSLGNRNTLGELRQPNIGLRCEGLVRYYYRSGAKRAEIMYKDGAANGRYKLYYENSTIAVEGNMVDGCADGYWRWNRKNGQPFLTGTYNAPAQADMARKWTMAISGKSWSDDPEETGSYYFDSPSNDTAKAVHNFLSYFLGTINASQTGSRRNGEFTFYNADGSKQSVLHFKNDVRVGTATYWKDATHPYVVIEYNENGRIAAITDLEGKRLTLDRFIDQWRKDNGVTVKATAAPASSDDEVMTFVEEMPTFHGDLFDWISQNMHYPEKARKQLTEGKVVVGFVVRKDGSVGAAKILTGVSPELDAEALRIVTSMPPWTPGRNGGKPVGVTFSLPVTFKIAR